MNSGREASMENNSQPQASVVATRPTVIEQFARQVQQTPDATAVVFEDSELSYRQLDELANRFANGLRQAGIRSGQTVGLCIERRPDAIAAMLGAFKIGAVYVPLDPEYPADRVRYMIDDADIQLVVTYDLRRNPLASDLFDMDCQKDGQRRSLLWIDSASESFWQLPTQSLSDYPAADDLAYIMYTSGSTGMPKGVQIEHRALSVYCHADCEIYELTPHDRTLQFSTLNFDIAIEEIFPPLLSGGVVVIRPQSRAASHNELSSIIERYQITAIHIATAYWHEWVDLMVASQATVPASLRLVIATGEKVSVEHYRRWKTLSLHPIKWCNAYGPTETTVTATVFVPDETFVGEHMPIGKPLAGYEAFILDEQQRPVEIGDTGALFIGGQALARGYHNNPEKTKGAFLTVDLPGRGPTRIYRTGDLARWLPSGDIEFAGRVDHQIKVGSYRIEPGEIEVAIAKFPGVLESIVVHEEVAGQKFLIAYVAVGGQSIELLQLKDFLRKSLPLYMVPPRYVVLPALPKTINGKIDRRSLPPASSSQIIADNNFCRPQTAVQQQLAAIWQRVLHYPSIGIHDDFFALGGSSLLVTRVVTAVTAELGISLPVRDFFANPTIASSAEHIERLLAAQRGEALPAKAATQAFCEIRSRLPKLHAAMIPVGGGGLFSVRYEPRQTRRNYAVLVCNSIGHEQTRAYRNLQQLSLHLAEQGFDVLRFDYRGTGNSTGDCESCTAESMLEDIVAAAALLREQTGLGPLAILGIRLGATLVSRAEVENVDQVILWDPVVLGSEFVRLLDSFHDETLLEQSRFAKVLQRSGRDQAYGHALGAAKRHSLNRLTMASQPREGWGEQLIVTSQGYGDQEVGMAQLSVAWRTHTVDDHLGWGQVEYAERAFSSPATFQAIVGALSARSDRLAKTHRIVVPGLSANDLPVGELVS